MALTIAITTMLGTTHTGIAVTIIRTANQGGSARPPGGPTAFQWTELREGHRSTRSGDKVGRKRSLSGRVAVVGIEEASGYISIVGSAIGEQINQDYRRAYEVSSLSREQVADVLVDLKRRIEGNFFIIEEDEGKNVLGTTACPFAEKVIRRRSMCMMTSKVLGHIAAENLGYGKVECNE
jgi:hypothetical protein